MKNKKGFTLIETLAVIIIIGVIMIIAVPAVSKYILKSNKTVYVSNVSAFLETIRSKYEMSEYGPLLKDEEIMIVPIKSVMLEKGNSEESPYGKYEPEKSYVIIVPERNKYSFYATVIDETNTGMIATESNSLDEGVIITNIEEEVPMISSFESVGALYEINGKIYKRVEIRKITGEDVNQEEYLKAYVFKEINSQEVQDDGIAYEIKLENNGATSPGTEKMYELYTVGWYSDEGATTEIRKITSPTKNGYEFLGYYSKDNGGGTQIITATGLVISGTERVYKSKGTMYAKWKECGDGYYSHNSVTCSMCPEGYRDGTAIENKTSENACIKRVSAGQHIATARATNTVSCPANTYANIHTVAYGNTSPCPACTSLGSNYTKSAGGTGDTGCYMTVAAGKYKTSAKGNSTSSCTGNKYSAKHSSYYGTSDSCKTCPSGQEPNSSHTDCVSSWSPPTCSSSSNCMTCTCACSKGNVTYHYNYNCGNGGWHDSCLAHCSDWCTKSGNGSFQSSANASCKS